jgi:hypothetical protein
MMFCRTFVNLFFALFIFYVSAQEAFNYQTPPQEIVDLVDAPGTPAVSFSPDASVMLILHRPELPTIEDLAMPEERLAGVRINPDNFGPSRAWYIARVELMKTGSDEMIAVTVLPQNPRIRNINWSANSNYVAFAHTHHTGIELWMLEVETVEARKMRARIGKKGAVVAGAHRLGRIIYTMMKDQQSYTPEIFLKDQQKWKDNRIKYLEKQLQKLKDAA